MEFYTPGNSRDQFIGGDDPTRPTNVDLTRRNKITLDLIEKAAKINNWSINYQKNESSSDVEAVSVSMKSPKNGVVSVYAFKIFDNGTATFDRTYRPGSGREVKTREERRKAETYILGAASPSRKDISIVFTLGNKLTGQGLTRRQAFARARALVQDPGSVNITEKEKNILRSYGVYVEDLIPSLRRVPKYKIKKELVNAIASKNLIKIHYTRVDEDKAFAPETRILEPFVYGSMVVKSGKKLYMLRGYQLSGGSGEGWRMYRVDRIDYMEIQTTTFKDPRSLYNFSGDKALKVIAQAVFTEVIE